MSDLPSLLLDIGNSSVKYGLLHPQFAFESIIAKRTTLYDLNELELDVASIFFSSVLSDDNNQYVFDFGERLNIPVFQCKSQRSQYNITNAYKTPSNMGDDRWMAIIAGVTLSTTDKNVLVVDSGSAITCDFVVSGKHIGGWIAPGVSMLRNTVVANTQRVFDREQKLNMLVPGADTPECVSSGALAQVSGMVQQAIFIMQQYDTHFDIYLSGGDAENIMNVIKQTTSEMNEFSLHYIENLVLVGLARIASEKTL